jgi:hypothetical protein
MSSYYESYETAVVSKHPNQPAESKAPPKRIDLFAIAMTRTGLQDRREAIHRAHVEKAGSTQPTNPQPRNSRPVQMRFFWYTEKDRIPKTPKVPKKKMR